MDARKITVVSTKTQTKVEFMSEATTLRELKNDLTNYNVDYNGMTFLEGLSKTELCSDDSILPTNVPTRNGGTTNELIFLMTYAKEKIKSGALSRKEMYDVLAENPELKTKFKNFYGYNFTHAPNEILEVFVEREFVKSNNNLKTSQNSINFEELTCLIKDLYQNGEISYTGKNKILALIKNAKVVQVPVSEKEISEMFDFVSNF